MQRKLRAVDMGGMYALQIGAWHTAFLYMRSACSDDIVDGIYSVKQLPGFLMSSIAVCHLANYRPNVSRNKR